MACLITLPFAGNNFDDWPSIPPYFANAIPVHVATADVKKFHVVKMAAIVLASRPEQAPV